MSMTDTTNKIILKANVHGYVGEGGTLNSNRDYAKRFDSEQDARTYAKENRIMTEFTVDAA